MYTLGARSHERRSTQTAMYLMCDGLARLLAPILPVTADDLWRHMPGRRAESVHLEEFPTVERYLRRAAARDLGIAARRARNGQRRARGEAQGQGDRQRRSARAWRSPRRARSARCSSSHRADLPMLFIVSDVELQRRRRPTAPTSVRVEVEKAPGVKCERCWRFVPQRPHRARLGRHLRPLRRRARRTGQLLTVKSLRSPLLRVGRRARRRPRSGRQGARPAAARALREHLGHSRLLQPDAGPQYRRRVRVAERRRLPVQDRPAGRAADRGAGRADGVCRDARTRAAADAAGPVARHRRRGRQPDRPRRCSATCWTSSTSIAGLALLGFQRRRRRHHHRCGADDPRPARSGTAHRVSRTV